MNWGTIIVCILSVTLMEIILSRLYEKRRQYAFKRGQREMKCRVIDWLYDNGHGDLCKHMHEAFIIEDLSVPPTIKGDKS